MRITFGTTGQLAGRKRTGEHERRDKKIGVRVVPCCQNNDERLQLSPILQVVHFGRNREYESQDMFCTGGRGFGGGPGFIRQGFVRAELHGAVLFMGTIGIGRETDADSTYYQAGAVFAF